jgi:hypothetical protein
MNTRFSYETKNRSLLKRRNKINDHTKNNLSKKKQRKNQKGGQNDLKNQPTQPTQLNQLNQNLSDVNPNNLETVNKMDPQSLEGMNNFQETNLNQDPRQNMNQDNLDEMSQETETETDGALVGAYDNPDKTKPESNIVREQLQAKGGLYVPFPPNINTTKEEAMELKLKDKREPGFTSYRAKMNDQIQPKFVLNNFYPKYSTYYELQPGYVPEESNANQLDEDLESNISLN